VLRKGSTGRFSVNLDATTGPVIATREVDERKASAISGIESMKRKARSPESDYQTDRYPAVPLDTGIGLAVPGRLIRSLVVED
jgi:uncharacterized protein YegP (UPF0339 family)